MNEVMTIGLGDLLPDPISNGAGGLFAHADIVEDTWTLGGLIQDEWIWGLELASTESWISMSPGSGILGPGENEEMILSFDATSLMPGLYSAIINFATIPDIGNPQVPVDLYVFSDELYPPGNFEVSLQCETLEVCWNVQNPTVDSFSIYINSQWIVNTTNFCYTVAGPDQYSLYVTAWYDGEETMPSAVLDFLIPWPSDSEPENLVIDSLVNTHVYLSWNEPMGCAVHDGYNLYCDGEKINEELIVDLFYCDIVSLAGPHEYYSTSVYYFGESDPSNSQTVIITSIPEIENSRLLIFPNPSAEKLYIHSESRILFISISDILGQEVYSSKVNDKDIVVDVFAFQKGIYFVRMDMEGKSQMKKILVE
ncbi:MAG: T9SS type A sorting domain-containing protein [Bacteroidales bacterium]